MKFFKEFILFIIIVFCACQPSKLELALRKSGDNRAELERVLIHYTEKDKDSLKWEAARFLIENMPEHYTYESEALTRCYQKIDSIQRNTSDFRTCKEQIDILNLSLGNFESGLKYRSDIQSVKASYLIDDIDLAFRQWREGLWARHLSFEEFCEYLLPYRIGNENLEAWRERLNNEYISSISWLKEQDDIKTSSYWAAYYLNDQIKKRGFNLQDLFIESPIDHPASVLAHMQCGSCNDYARSAVYIMRACGIPVGMDFVIQWPFRSHAHTWNVLLDNCGLDIPFMGGESNPGYPNKPGYRRGKVFRQTFAYQKDCLFARKGNESIPEHFNTPFIKDVSDQYFKGKDIDVHLSSPLNERTRFAYLAVFNNQRWIPVQWGSINWLRKAVFRSMEPGIVYLPVYYIEGAVQGAGDPILLTPAGEKKVLKANTENRQRMVLRRKFPVFGGVLYYSSRMVGGFIEATNDPTFKDRIVVGTIRRNPMMHYDTLNCNIPGKYRYWRYVSPVEGHCNVAELEFFSGERKIIPDTVYAACPSTDGHPLTHAFDGDGLTYYESGWPDWGYIDADFGKPVSMDYFKYLPRNDDNNITPGNLYELFYWDNKNWHSMGEITAISDSLVYDYVPSGALYLLRNHDRGSEERIFTWEGGEQVWW